MTAERALDFLLGFYGLKDSYPEQAKVYLRAFLEIVEPKDTRSIVIKRAVERFPRRMPSIEQLRTLHGEVKQEQWQVEKQKTPRDLPPVPPHSVNAAHAEASFKLIRKISHGQCRGMDRIAAFSDMEARFPGYGWREAADEETARLAKKP